MQRCLFVYVSQKNLSVNHNSKNTKRNLELFKKIYTKEIRVFEV